MYFTRHFKNDLFGRYGYLKRVFLLFSVGVLLLGISGNIRAEEKTEDYVLEDTVVTATKTGETNIQETPISITAFSADTLKDSRSSKLTDLDQLVPGAQFDLYGPYPTGYIRGVGTQQLWATGDQNVGFYVDGVYMEKGFGINADFLDVERVEVLRGPQGTLYGRNSIAGSVNIITKTPSDEWEATGGLEVGNYGKIRADANVSGPLVKDKVKARLSFSDSQHDSYANNVTGMLDPDDEDYTGARGMLEFTLTDSVDIRLSGDYYDSKTNGMSHKLINDQGVTGLINAGNGISGEDLIPSDFHDVAIGEDQWSDMEFWGTSANVNINLSQNLSLKSITSYRELDRSHWLDMDGSPARVLAARTDEEIEQFAQEIQLNGNWGPWKALTGLYYYNSQDDLPILETHFGFFGVPGGVVNNWVSNIETDSYAVFGNVTYAATDKLNLNVGARYSYDERDFYWESLGNGAPFFPAEVWEAKEGWGAFTPSFGSDYKINDDAFLFATVSRGFKSGNFAPVNPTTLGREIEPEFMWNYEIGAKTDWFDNLLRVNAALFYMDYTDMQVRSYQSGNLITENAGEATITGAEIEVQARPFRPLTLTGSVSYLNAEFDEFTTQDLNGNTFDAKGQQLPYAPDWKLVFGTQYVHELSKYGFLTFRGDVSWTDTHYSTALNNSESQIDDHTVVNALVRYETRGGKWSVDLFGGNLFDEEYFRFVQSLTGFPSDSVGSLGDPRTIGVQVVCKF